MKKLCIGVILFVLTFGFASQVEACSCAPGLVTTDYYTNADIIFSGIASYADGVVDENFEENEYIEVDFVVYDSWKGYEQDPRIVTVLTVSESAACGYSFEEGKEYLVYANIDRDGKNYTNSCSGTKLLTASNVDLNTLTEISEGTIVIDSTTNTNEVVEEIKPSPSYPEWKDEDLPLIIENQPIEKTEPSNNTALVIGMIIVGLVTLGLIVGAIFYFAKKK